MKQRKPPNLFLPLLWFIAAGLWGVSSFRAFTNGTGGHLVNAAVALACLILGIVNLRRYLRSRR